MKLPLFKKRDDEQSEIDRIIQENIEKGNEVMPEEPTEQPIAPNKDATLRKLEMDVDKLKAQVEAFIQMRQLSEQKFQRISEELGDLRRGNMEREKEISLLRVEATKACDLVGSVQPEKLMLNLDREKIRIEELSAMHEANKKLLDYMADEIKKLRTETSAFRGTESLIKLNDEVKGELNAIKKVQLTVEKHADKVEDIFINMQKKFSDFMRLSDEFKSFQNSFNEVAKNANSFKTEFNNLATKEDLAKFDKIMTEKFMSIENLKKDLNNSRQEMGELLLQANTANSSIKSLESTLEGRIAEIDGTISKLEMGGYVTIQKLDDELDEFFKNILEKMEEHKKEVEGKISSLKNETTPPINPDK